MNTEIRYTRSLPPLSQCYKGIVQKREHQEEQTNISKISNKSKGSRLKMRNKEDFGCPLVLCWWASSSLSHKTEYSKGVLVVMVSFEPDVAGGRCASFSCGVGNPSPRPTTGRLGWRLRISLVAATFYNVDAFFFLEKSMTRNSRSMTQFQKKFSYAALLIMNVVAVFKVSEDHSSR